MSQNLRGPKPKVRPDKEKETKRSDTGGKSSELSRTVSTPSLRKLSKPDKPVINISLKTPKGLERSKSSREKELYIKPPKRETPRFRDLGFDGVVSAALHRSDITSKAQTEPRTPASELQTNAEEDVARAEAQSRALKVKLGQLKQTLRRSETQKAYLTINNARLEKELQQAHIARSKHQQDSDALQHQINVLTSKNGTLDSVIDRNAKALQDYVSSSSLAMDALVKRSEQIEKETDEERQKTREQIFQEVTHEKKWPEPQRFSRRPPFAFSQKFQEIRAHMAKQAAVKPKKTHPTRSPTARFPPQHQPPNSAPFPTAKASPPQKEAGGSPKNDAWAFTTCTLSVALPSRHEDHPDISSSAVQPPQNAAVRELAKAIQEELKALRTDLDRPKEFDRRVGLAERENVRLHQALSNLQAVEKGAKETLEEESQRLSRALASLQAVKQKDGTRTKEARAVAEYLDQERRQHNLTTGKLEDSQSQLRVTRSLLGKAYELVGEAMKEIDADFLKKDRDNRELRTDLLASRQAAKEYQAQLAMDGDRNTHVTRTVMEERDTMLQVLDDACRRNRRLEVLMKAKGISNKFIQSKTEETQTLDRYGDLVPQDEPQWLPPCRRRRSRRRGGNNSTSPRERERDGNLLSHPSLVDINGSACTGMGLKRNYTVAELASLIGTNTSVVMPPADTPSALLPETPRHPNSSKKTLSSTVNKLFSQLNNQTDPPPRRDHTGDVQPPPKFDRTTYRGVQPLGQEARTESDPLDRLSWAQSRVFPGMGIVPPPGTVPAADTTVVDFASVGTLSRPVSAAQTQHMGSEQLLTSCLDDGRICCNA
uniref:Uncharacterized protein n=1 Tax=Chromera velia CCMP2878 TaxID=1169474 RepID=A0A0G4IB21_9ALVE|eukprot:Cvel_12750.t1-p1 / transcript=Cvel_12750.t1 / gene=Cvel_12750 / organism=Chromera_velia_CCMP2878 / gene_product=Rootletin, putative / transcript_product=Rootletin, putative / location=Cvel_scaffold847:34376-37739(-) / protein_length=825 / sequence_SO=supercontig / SO=protein_coding / is_pseudo=false